MLRIKNWYRFQHYKDRNPPWIKLHYELLTSRTWVMLDDASKALAVACMLLASRNDGQVPADPDYLQRVAYLQSRPNLKALIDLDFFEDASGLLASARPETETETETETESVCIDHKPKPQSKRFKKPTLAQVEEYITEKSYHFKPERFIAYYESKGWKVGKAPMKDWKAACRTFELNWLEQHPGQDPDREFDQFGYTRAERGLR